MGAGRRRRDRRAGRPPRRPRRAPAGCDVTTTVVRPARWPRSREAIRASVWASTAEVGSTRTRISGSPARARARTSRCRWPPEKVRPRSATTVSRPVGQRLEDVVGRGGRRGPRDTSPRRRCRARSPRRPENSVAPVSETTIRRRTSARRSLVSGTPPRVTSSSTSGAQSPSRSARAAASSGWSLTSAVISPGRILSPVRASRRLRARRRWLGRVRRVEVVGRERQHPAYAAGRDPGPDQLVGVLGGGPQRDHQERRVAVEGDELTGADLALDGVPGAEPDHEDHEDAGQEHLERVEHRLQPSDLYAGLSGGLRLTPVAVVEDLLAADAAQHTKPADDVAGGVGELAHEVALVGAAARRAGAAAGRSAASGPARR